MHPEPVAWRSLACDAGGLAVEEVAPGVKRLSEAALLPAVREAGPEEIIVADGTSCRHQIRDLAGRDAIHSIRLMERALVGR